MTIAPRPQMGTKTRSGLTATPIHEHDCAELIAHLGRDVLHASRDRDFSAAYRRTLDGDSLPQMYPAWGRTLRYCAYVRLTHPQHAAVVVMDIDRRGREGGKLTDLHQDVYARLDALCRQGAGPRLVGINPVSGKAQAIWLIDPVYRGKDRSSTNWRALEVLHSELSDFLGADRHFSHGFSRSPLLITCDPTAYRWWSQPQPVHRVSDLIEEVRRMTGKTDDLQEKTETYTSGWERIAAAQAARAQAQALAELDMELEDASTQHIDGVAVRWITQGRAARDETAFRHALKTAYALHKAGKRMTDGKIIDAYERAYELAQAVGGDGRPSEMPPARDRLTMARRCRGYVTSGKATPTGQVTSDSRSLPVTRQSSAGRKALATLGRRGGKKAAQRWTDPESADYTEKARAALDAATERRKIAGELLEAKIKMAILEARTQGLPDPTTKSLAGEFGVSVARVKQVRQKLGLQARRGRPKKG